MKLGIAALMGQLTGHGGTAAIASPFPPARSVDEQTKSHLHDVMLDHIAQTQDMLRTVQANSAGLPANFSRPFPGSSTTINASQQPGLAALAGHLLMAGALVALVLLAWQNRGPLMAQLPEPKLRVKVLWGDEELLPGQQDQTKR